MIIAGADADLLLLEEKNLSLNSTMARGEWMVKDGTILKFGSYERR